MKKEEIIKNNILIADFLSWPKYESFNYKTPFYQPYLSTGAGICETNLFHNKELHFHDDWKWLMFVIEKISISPAGNYYDEPIYSYPRTFGMMNNKTKKFMFRFNGHRLFEEKTLIDAAYLAVIEFIKRKNEKK